MRQFAYLLICLAACSSDHQATVDAPASVDTAPSPDASNLLPVTFTYTPSWTGVVSVDVIGQFNQAADWTTPFISLTASGSTFTGTAMLPPGTYPYLFHVVGDTDAGAAAATFPRYSIDGTITDFVMCPAASPTAGADPNPCSQLTVPQVAAPTPYHIQGTVQKAAAGVAKWLVVLEREEATSHHFFVDRMTTTANGNYDFVVAPGQYRVQVQNPTYESKKDTMLDPPTLATVRRSLTTSFALAAADVTVPTTDVAFTQYAAFAPKTTATLPTTFTFSTGATDEARRVWLCGGDRRSVVRARTRCDDRHRIVRRHIQHDGEGARRGRQHAHVHVGCRDDAGDAVRDQVDRAKHGVPDRVADRAVSFRMATD